MDLLKQIVKVLEDKKAIDIKEVDIKEKTTIADYFVVASGTSSTHIKALADNVEEKLKEQGIKPVKIEGYNSGTWILMDYSDVIVHIFTAEEREHYNLEDLWEKIDKK